MRQGNINIEFKKPKSYSPDTFYFSVPAETMEQASAFIPAAIEEIRDECPDATDIKVLKVEIIHQNFRVLTSAITTEQVLDEAFRAQ